MTTIPDPAAAVTKPVTGGVDTHADMHVAAAVNQVGGVLGTASFPTTPAGYRQPARLAPVARRPRRGRGRGDR